MKSGILVRAPKASQTLRNSRHKDRILLGRLALLGPLLPFVGATASAVCDSREGGGRVVEKASLLLDVFCCKGGPTLLKKPAIWVEQLRSYLGFPGSQRDASPEGLAQERVFKKPPTCS